MGNDTSFLNSDAAFIFLLNIAAPSSHDIRVVNYVVPINEILPNSPCSLDGL